MKNFKRLNIIVMLILFALVSCVKQNNIDFTQTSNLTFNKEIKSAFISFKIDSSDVKGINLLPMGPAINFETPFNIFNNTEFEKHLQEADFHFEIENTYDRDFKLVINFLDINKNTTYSSTPIIVNKNATTIKDIKIKRADVLKLVQSINANIIISIQNITSTNSNPSAFLNLKSSAILYLLY